MLGLEKELNKEKHQFRSYYCGECKQQKPCGALNGGKCCSCFYQTKQGRTQAYTSYQQVYQQKAHEQKARIQQLKLLREYAGCSQCGRKEADAYNLYVENKLVCQPCRMKKEGGSSGPISFLEEQKRYQKCWGISLNEWLNNYDCLPVNVNCAKKWLKDKEHLKNCQCLEQESQETYELFTNSLKQTEEKLKKCKCIKSEKTRTPYYDSGNYGYAYCEICEEKIKGAGKTGKIKNRNDPKFWGLEVKERILCGECLENKKGDMKPLRRAEFNRYRKEGKV